MHFKNRKGMIILKFIFFVFLFLFILGFVASFFLKRALKKMAKNLNKNFSEQQGFNNPNYTNTKTQSKRNLDDHGEYVDFEEIKE